VGKAQDLAVDMQAGRIVHVIVDPGLGSAPVAIPPALFSSDPAKKALNINATKDQIKQAPKFDLSKWTESYEPSRVAETYRFYGQQPYYGEQVATEKVPGVNAAPTARPIQSDQTPKTPSDQLPKNPLEQPPKPLSDRPPSASTAQVPTNPLDQPPKTPSDRLLKEIRSEPVGATSKFARLGTVERASKVMGTAVRNRQNESLGKVENLMVDIPAGRIVSVVISSGGFLGIGDEHSAVPPMSLRFDPQARVFQLDTTKEQLSRAPHFSGGAEWPVQDGPYVSGLYRAYGIEPYFDTPVQRESDRPLTVLDQGTSESDVTLTTSIRKELTAREELSVHARNVKIITINGRVTLRGAVKSEDEKRIVGEIAARLAGQDKVDNQLEVKQSLSQN
jgi:sporulation protein YlmC with PRC-barrel domain